MRRVNSAAKSWYGAESSRQLIVISPIVENSSEINATVYLRTRMYNKRSQTVTERQESGFGKPLQPQVAVADLDADLEEARALVEPPFVDDPVEPVRRAAQVVGRQVHDVPAVAVHAARGRELPRKHALQAQPRLVLVHRPLELPAGGLAAITLLAPLVRLACLMLALLARARIGACRSLRRVVACGRASLVVLRVARLVHVHREDRVALRRPDAHEPQPYRTCVVRVRSVMLLLLRHPYRPSRAGKPARARARV